MDVSDLIIDKIKDQTTTVKTHCELMELKTENSNLELKHLMEQCFLEQDTRLKGIETTIKEVSSSQALLAKTLLKLIEDAKKGKSSEVSVKEQRGQQGEGVSRSSKGPTVQGHAGHGASGSSQVKIEPKKNLEMLSAQEMEDFTKLFEK
ncbi:hypothetical protein Dimus_011139, partial [Dionaea muscipula]